MALFQILSKRHPVTLADGTPLRGGTLTIKDPNSGINLPVFADSALQVRVTNPVVLDAAGKAEAWVTEDCDIDIRNANGDLLDTLVNQNPTTAVGGNLIPNGSFEIDATGDGVPDGWTLTSETGSTNAIDSTTATDGVNSMKFESTGSGGGNIITNEFFPVNDVDDLSINFDIVSDVADVRNIVRIEWFDASQASISNTDVYDDATTNPTSFTAQTLTATPPANARFAKLRLIGCDPSDATVGETNFDRVNVFYPLVVSGAFDNLLLSGNTISSTDTDGDINLTPDGEGRVVTKGEETKWKLADTARNNTITQTADPDLAGFQLKPSAVYEVDIVLRFEGNGATANGFRWSFDFNGQLANVTQFFGHSFSFASSGGVESIIGNVADTSQTKAAFDGAGVREKVVAKLLLVTGASYVEDTAIDLQWAQGASNATNTSLEIGSFMSVRRVG